jgi:hypothetical protein
MNIIKTIAFSFVAVAVVGCGDTNSDGLPTSLDAHIEMVLDQKFDELKDGPKQTYDKVISNYSKTDIQNCMVKRTKPNGEVAPNIQQLYANLKKYKLAELDDTTKMQVMGLQASLEAAFIMCIEKALVIKH